MEEKRSLSPEQRRKLLELRRKQPNALAIPKRERKKTDETFPVSSSQRRLWFLYQMQPNSIEYNVPVAFYLLETIDVEACEGAINDIVARHEVLRTTFTEVEGEPVQLVHKEFKADFQFVDASQIDESERKYSVDQKVKEVTNCIFDLENGPLFRSLLVKEEDEKYVLAMVAHHIITDSWSFDILKQEFEQFYRNRTTDTVTELPELKIQYGDFALWQQQEMNKHAVKDKLNYWVTKLKGAISDISLPTDFERPPVRTAEGESYFFELTEEQSVEVKEQAKHNGCTVFMYLLAVFQVFLYHYTKEERITVGTTISNRPTKETEQLIGFFINNIVYNTYIADGIPFEEYLQRVKKETLAMYLNQDVPFEKVVDELHVKRDLSRTAVFQVMFNYLSASGEVDKVSGMKSDIYPLGGSKATTDYNLFSWDNDGRIKFIVEYSTDLFKNETVVRFAKHYKTILMTLTKQPELKVDQVEFIDNDERTALLDKEISEVEPVNLSYMPYRKFEEWAQKTPEAIAIHFEGKKMNYVTLNRKANQVAHELIEQGIQIGDRIGLYMDRSIEMMIGMLAVQKAGGVYVPLDPTYPSTRIEAIMNQSHVRIVLTQRYLLANIPETDGCEILCLESLLQNAGEEKTDNLNLPIQGEDLMYILFTSGSTGEPKGVMIRHSNYASYIKAILERLHITEPLQYIVVTTFAADLGSFCLYAPLLTGGSVHIVAYEKATDGEWLADYFKNNTIDVIKMVPSHFEALQSAEHAELIVPRKLLIFAGEAVHKETIQKVYQYNRDCKVWNNYGPSETTVSVLAYEITQDNLDDYEDIPLGQPLSNAYGYVLDEKMNPVPYGVIGELYLGGNGVAAGYLNRDELTKERFLEDPFHKDNSKRIYKTGDLVRRMPDGNIMFLGRVDRQVKVRGYRIELGEIEEVLRNLEQVDEAVVNLCKEGENSYLCAYVILNPNFADVTTSEIRKAIKKKIPDYWMPSFFMILDTIPLNPNGKVDYKALPLPSKSGQLEDAYVAPRNEIEEELAKIWCETLGIERVGIDDDFFDLGGESFKAVKMIRKIGRGISVIDLFKFPSIRALYGRITGQVEQETGRLVRLTPKPQGKVSMTYICFPFAGGSAISFQPLANNLSDKYQLFGVRLPGHDFSSPEDVGGTMDSLIDELVQEIKEKVTGPISIYAQCVSGAMGIALAYALENCGFYVHTVFEAANFPTPRLPGKLADWWAKIFPSDRWMSNRVYRETLKSLGNSDESNNREEDDFIIAGIRHDARMAQDYFSSNYYDKEYTKLKAPICCIIGERDRSTEFYSERYHEWERYSDDVTYEVIEDAGHFFHKHQPKELWGIMVQRLIEQKKKSELEEAKEVIDTKKVEGQGYGKQLSMKLFFIIIVGQIVSILGSNLSGFAVGIWLYGDTGSIGNFSLVSVCSLVPSMILAPIAGMVADRYDKRKIMIFGDLFGIIGTFMVYTLYSTGNLKVWHICLSIIIGSIGGSFQRPAFLSAIPILVPKCYLGQANGILQFISSGGQMLGPILGASALYAFGMKGVLFLDFISCFATVGTLLFIRFPEREFKKREEPFKKELIGGWNYIWKRHSMVVMVVYFVVANFLMSLVTVVFTPLAIGVSTEKQLGIVLGTNAAGVVVGSLIMSLWGGTKRRATGMVGFLILTSISMIIMGLRPSPIFVGAGLFLFGASIAFVDTHWQIMIQSKVGLELQGRVFSINEMIVSIFRPFAFLLAPVLIDSIFKPLMDGDSALKQMMESIIGSGDTRGVGLFVTVVGVILLVFAVFGMKYRPLRYMEDYLPDAIPGAIIYKDKDKMQQEMDLMVRE